jgi:hypothetical protein
LLEPSNRDVHRDQPLVVDHRDRTKSRFEKSIVRRCGNNGTAKLGRDPSVCGIILQRFYELSVVPLDGGCSRPSVAMGVVNHLHGTFPQIS